MLNSLSTCAEKCKTDAIKFYYLDSRGARRGEEISVVDEK